MKSEIMEKIATIKENERKVYRTGYEKGLVDGEGTGINPEWTDWRYMFAHGARDDLLEKLLYSDTAKGKCFSHMFYQNRNITEAPDFDMSAATFDNNAYTTVSHMFYDCRNLKKAPSLLYAGDEAGTFGNIDYIYYNCENMEGTVNIDVSQWTSYCGSMYRSFYNCKKATEINLDMAKFYGEYNAFYGCSALETINGFAWSMLDTSDSSAFYGCSALKNLIPSSNKYAKVCIDLNLRYSPLLTKESILNVINMAKDIDSWYTPTITFSKTAVNNAFETSSGAADGSTSAEWETLIASLPTSEPCVTIALY